MALDKPKELPYLIRFGLTVNLLEIHQLRNFRVDKDMMASANPGGTEAKALNQILHVRKGDIRHRSVRESPQQRPPIHTQRVPRFRVKTRAAPNSREANIPLRLDPRRCYNRVDRVHPTSEPTTARATAQCQLFSGFAGIVSSSTPRRVGNRRTSTSSQAILKQSSGSPPLLGPLAEATPITSCGG